MSEELPPAPGSVAAEGRTTKACSYCAEEIADAAIVCPYCGSDLGPPPPVGGGGEHRDRPIELLHVGERYGLGTATEGYGIWDARAPGPPAHRFPRTDQGWRDAWETFSRLEPTAKPVGGSVAWGPDTPGLGGPGGAGFAGHGQIVGAAQRTNGPAVASLVLGILGVVLWFPLLGLLLGVLASVFGYLGLRRAETTGVGRGLAIAGLALGVVAVGIGVLILAVFREVADQVSRIQELQELSTPGT